MKNIRAQSKSLALNSRLHLFPEKLCSHWGGPFIVTQVFSHGAIELKNPK